MIQLHIDTSSVTKRLDIFSIFGHLTKKNYPVAQQLAKVGTNVCQIQIKPHQKLPKDFNILPKLRNFAKSGRLGYIL